MNEPNRREARKRERSSPRRHLLSRPRALTRDHGEQPIRRPSSARFGQSSPPSTFTSPRRSARFRLHLARPPPLVRRTRSRTPSCSRDSLRRHTRTRTAANTTTPRPTRSRPPKLPLRLRTRPTTCSSDSTTSRGGNANSPTARGTSRRNKNTSANSFVYSFFLSSALTSLGGAHTLLLLLSQSGRNNWPPGPYPLIFHDIE